MRDRPGQASFWREAPQAGESSACRSDCFLTVAASIRGAVSGVFEPVGSTSWHHRHLPALTRLGELLREHGPSEPTVMIVGPGAVTVLAAPFLNDSAAVDASPLRRLIGDGARYLDQLIRRVPFMPLVSLEPLELSAALNRPHRLVAVDRSRRILRAVRRRRPDAACCLLDIVREAPPVTADAVVAFNVICRLDDPPAGMRHVAAAVRPGGYLLIDDRSGDAYLNRAGMADAASTTCEFRRIAPKIHQRTVPSSSRPS